MWTTRGLPITPFLEKFVGIAIHEGYKYILLLVARPADEYTLYENLYRDWKSIDELTGKEIMFLFVGPDARREELGAAGFLAQESGGEEICFSPYVAVSGGHRIPRQCRPERLNNGYSFGSLAGNVASPRDFENIVNSHEAQIKQLRRRFSLKEVELPALVLITTTTGSEDYSASVRGITSLYSLLQCLVDEIEDLEELKRNLRKYGSKKTPETRVPANYRRSLDVLSTASLSPDSPLGDLYNLLQEAHPWNCRRKSEQLRTLLQEIKADSACAWFYRKHRGLIQSVADYLKVATDSSILISYPRIDVLRKQISEREKTLLTRALDQHACIYCRDDHLRELQVDRVDVFVSYSRSDLEKAEALEAYLTKIGYTVWRDDAIRAGFSFRSEIRSALFAAKVIVVLWTKHSIRSEWVEWEAAMAHRRKKYLPLTDGTVNEHHLPPPFGNYHFVSLNDRNLVKRSLAQFVKGRGH